MLIATTFISNTTIHGLNNLVTTRHHVIRLLWIILIGLSIYVCGYTAYSTTVDYLGFDVITVTKNVEEKEVVFPAVTVCVNKEQEFRLSTAHINRCTFEEKNCNIKTDFEAFVREDAWYYCIRFNGYRQNYSLKTIKSRKSVGLTLDLNLNGSQIVFYVQDNYLNTFDDSLKYTMYQHDTLRVYATKTVDQKLGEPYNQCKEVEDVAYRQKNCIEICIREHVASAMNCSLKQGYYKLMNNNRNLTVCSSFDGVVREKVKNATDHCQVDCPKECDSIFWSVSIKPENEFLENQRVTTIQVLVSQMVHLELTQKIKTTFWDYLSSLGGTLGFLGMSFLSFAEIFELVVELISNVLF